jgi:hypothetical protein
MGHKAGKEGGILRKRANLNITLFLSVFFDIFLLVELGLGANAVSD